MLAYTLDHWSSLWAALATSGWFEVKVGCCLLQDKLYAEIEISKVPIDIMWFIKFVSFKDISKQPFSWLYAISLTKIFPVAIAMASNLHKPFRYGYFPQGHITFALLFFPKN